MLVHLIDFADTGVTTFVAMLAGAGVLHALPRIGPIGRRISEMLCRAPALDWVVTYFTVLPLIVGPLKFGWIGLAGAVVGQVGAFQLWVFLHERAHPQAMRGPRIVKVHNRLIGPWRNHAALWVTALVVPMFWIVRLVEICIWPAITALARLPNYRQGEWVRVSRHKFEGLVGHDLIWCLYCDWMTGLWSLGSEMLRNVESFWCPIRFANGKKCENCAIDFPDLDHGWVPANGTMAQVAAKLEQMHGAGPPYAWFGHPARMTVRGKPYEPVAR